MTWFIVQETMFEFPRQISKCWSNFVKIYSDYSSEKLVNQNQVILQKDTFPLQSVMMILPSQNSQHT